MPKTKTRFVCSNCGKVSASYMGRCPSCGEFNTFEEEIIERAGSSTAKRRAGLPRTQPMRLSEIEEGDEERLPLPMPEFSRVLGGGIVPGSVVLLGGDPGIGKSTLLLQVAAMMADSGGPVLYVSGEESARQIKMRAARLDIKADDLYLVTETDLPTIIEHTEKINPRLLVVDSIQTTTTPDLTSAAGTVTQVRECATQLQALAKSSGLAVFVVGHVTKEGVIAGPRVLEHIVDTVLYLEGDHFQAYRLLRSVKNRFGATNEVGVFEMLGSGLAEVANPSEAFLAERVVNASGSAIAVTMEGTRSLLVEVQALTSATTFGHPRRTPNGIDMNRLLLLTAVLSKRVGLRLSEQDVFVNVIGGLRVQEPAADLAIAAAIASSARELPIPPDLALIGEVGLSGELRAVSQLQARLNEAAQLGFKRVVVPKSARRKEITVPEGLTVVPVRTLHQALGVTLPERES